MSRRSLRLDDGLLDRSLPRSSASFAVGGSSWRSSRLRHSQRHSASCSESLLVGSPRKDVSRLLHNSSIHSVASDASLISSLLDESSIQESTLVETFWGLDQDADSKETNVLSNESSYCAMHLDQPLSRVCCNDCNCPSAPKADMEISTVYGRDRSGKARPARHGGCGVMALRETNPKEPRAVGSLCDDCREKQRSQLDVSSASSSSSWSSSLLGFIGSAAVFTGCSAGDAIRWISRRWSCTSSSSRLSGLVLLLLLIVAGVYSLLPSLNVDVPALSSVHSSSSSQSQSEEGATEELAETRLSAKMPPDELSSAPPPAEVESERLVQMQQSLKALWEEMEAARERAEQCHGELLQVYADLHQQAPGSHHSKHEVELHGLMERQLSLLHGRLAEERRQREQMRRHDLLLLKSQTSRLDQLELLMEQIAAESRELQQTHELDTGPPAALPATASRASTDKQSQEALQAVVSRLEAALVEVRREINGLSGCRDGCQTLDRIPQTIIEQVSVLIREEVRALVYGNQLTHGGDSILPGSLLQWLSQKFIGEADLQEALSTLEYRILQNISQRLRRQHSEEPINEAVLDKPGDGVAKQEVHVIVMEALRLFSQDRTGLADYALESGGGSILSTRCSETYETKAALLSLFGFPLWYFSQSPRVVIQPDVHPGNCWAFRGSKGFLVIQLSMKILPTAFTMEHISKALAPSGTLRSAPRDFSVHGLRDEHQERGKLLGNYTYDEDGEDLQMFSISKENTEAFQIIEVQVLSNWGHPEYTCMYRFRVHGTPSDV